MDDIKIINNFNLSILEFNNFLEYRHYLRSFINLLFSNQVSELK
jgi:hypothetical protein